MKLKTLLGLTLVLAIGCGDNKSYRLENDTPFVSTLNTEVTKPIPGGTRTDHTSSSAGNLIATAMREVHDLDIALYPRDLINEENVAFVQAGLNGEDFNNLLNLYPLTGNKDEFMVGVMRGRDIKKLIRTRIQDNLKLDIEVAGMVYHIHMVAGVVNMETYGLDNGRNFEDGESYRIAINQHFFFSGETFPSYKFRNGLNFSFVPNGEIISAKDTLQRYLAKVGELPYLKETRGRFSTVRYNHAGTFKTYEVQGSSHRSPLWSKRVTTSGVVTAVDNVEWYPRGIDIIIQDPQGDGNDATSDAVMVHLDGDTTNVKVGDFIEVTGTVYEQMTLDVSQNMSKTVIRELTNDDIKIISSNNPLPAPVLIGMQGRRIPDEKISTWTGDLNFKPFLNLNDGIDYWESLESMRIKVKNPRVAGFRGGQEELVRLNPQRHLSLYIVPDGFNRAKTRTLVGGLMEDIMEKDFSPEVIHLSAGNLTHDLARQDESKPRINYPRVSDEVAAQLKPDLSNAKDFPELGRNRDFQDATKECSGRSGYSYFDTEAKRINCQIPGGLLNTTYHYNVGDIFKGEIEGILSFESNLFGGGEYTMVIPEATYRYQPGVPQLKNNPCVVHAYEYLNQSYVQAFDVGIQNSSCEEITRVRGEVEKAFKGDVGVDAKISSAANSFLRPSFEKNDDGTPKKIINCLGTNFYSKPMPFECRPQTTLKGEGRHLTIAAYNLENLAGNQEDRIEMMGTAVRHNLKCPDILSLVEVQDDNGLDLEGGADASKTLQKIITKSKCKADGVDYTYINVNPVNHNEGGQPGGNIRVAIIYNQARVSFTKWGQPTDGPLTNGTLQETRLTPEGNLSVNPGRVFPNSEAFKNTRKSIVAQFDFKGEKVFVIGNHFNSKLGDTSTWGARQPFYSYSDEERALLGATINEFVRIIEFREPNAHIAVLGDFNANYNERSMRALENGDFLINMMFHKDLVLPNDRYSHNHNGASSAIDFIFANRNFMAKKPAFEVLHINSDYMGRLSDHDPVIARFYFPYESQAQELTERNSEVLVSQKDNLGLRIVDSSKVKAIAEIENNFLSNGSVLNPLLFAPAQIEKIKKASYCESSAFAAINFDSGLNGKVLSIKTINDRVQDKRRVIDIEFNELPLTLSCLKKEGDVEIFTGDDLNSIVQGAFESSLL